MSGSRVQKLCVNDKLQEYFAQFMKRDVLAYFLLGWPIVQWYVQAL